MPRVRVAAILETDHGLVLVRHRKDGREYHLLPGGGVDFGETLSDALEREVLEETGLACRVGAPVIVNDSIAPDGSRHVVQITFTAEVTGGTISKPLDARVAAVDVIPRHELEALDLRPPIADAILSVVSGDAPPPGTYLGAVWSVADTSADSRL